MNNAFQQQLLTREIQMKTMFDNLQVTIEELKDNELKWCSLFLEFYSKNDYLTNNQRDVLESIYNRVMIRADKANLSIVV